MGLFWTTSAESLCYIVCFSGSTFLPRLLRSLSSRFLSDSLALLLLEKVPPPCDGDRLRRLLAELIACKPRRLIVLRNHAPHVQFIVSAARGVEVQP